MNSMRNFICVLMALMLAAFALPSMGAGGQSQNKTYTLTMSVLTQGEGGGPSRVQAFFTNTSPRQSSSTFSSVDLSVSLNWSIDLTNVSITEGTSTTQTGNVDPSSPPGHLVISNLSPVKANETLTVIFNVATASCGDATWGAAVWSGSQIGSGNFFTSQSAAGAGLTSVACDSLACGEATPPATVTAGLVLATRDVWNKDGTFNGCTPADYFASNTLGNFAGLPPNVVHFRWDVSAFSTAAFSYKVYYAVAPASPLVGWLNQQDGTPATAPGADPSNVAFIAAPTCMSGQLPTPYGVLSSPLNSLTDTTIKVDTSTGALPVPSTVPDGFPIVIGTERMQVIAISNGTWTVIRNTGGTSPAKHSKNSPVASTPLPLLPASQPFPYATNPPGGQLQAQVCEAGSGTESGVPFVIYFDIADSWSHP